MHDQRLRPAGSSISYRYIKNPGELIEHGLSALRQDALDVLERVLDEVNPYCWCRERIVLSEGCIELPGLCIDLPADANVWVIGAGKASMQIARGVEDQLGERLRGGLIVCKEGETGCLRRIQVAYASHPIPSNASVEAAMGVLRVARQARSGDVVISVVTGGSSALMTLPCVGLAIEDLQALTRLLLTCGADIFEINAVRKHLSQVGGGRLAEALAPGVQLINLTVSDVVGDALDYVCDPTVADTSTIADARTTLDKYALWERVPTAVKLFLEPGGGVSETPKVLPWPDSHNILLLSASSAVEAAARAAANMGYNVLVLSSSFDGESRSVGETFAAVAREASIHGRPVKPPYAVIGGGETIVTMSKFEGLGGPNQEFALSAAMGLTSCGEVVVLGVDTDGTDGPTDYAGGLCDSETLRRARALGVDVRHALRQHTVTDALKRLGDAISTGPTGSNVNDLKFMLCRK